MVIGLVADNVYTPEALKKIGRITEKIREMPEVKSVASLTNAQDVDQDRGGNGHPARPGNPDHSLGMGGT